MAGGINPFSVQMQQLQRRQAIADMLQQQGMQPLEGSMSGTGNYPIYVKPSALQGLSKVAQAVMGAGLSKSNDAKYQDLDNQRMAAQKSEMAKLLGSPADISASMPPESIRAPGYQPPAQPPAGSDMASRMAAAQGAIGYGADPDLVKTIVASQLKPPGNEPNSVREYEFAKTNGFQGSFQDWIAAGGQSSRPSSVQEWEFYNKLPGAEQPRYLEMKRNPNMVVKDIGSVPTVIAPRVSGTSTVPLSSIGREAAGASAIKEAEARGGAVGKAQGDITGGIQTRGANAVGTENLLDIADPLIDVATGSTVGAGVDAVSKFFGKPTGGAEAIAKLKVLQAGLMTSMPRMEGPQSDADVKLYREAAGQIGDPTVPGAIKKAALQTVRQIQQKYVERAGTKSPAKTLVYDPASGTFK